MLSAEIYISPAVNDNALVLLNAIRSACRSAGIIPVTTESYSGTCEWLILYGVGAEGARDAWRAHREKGRRVIMWDLGYWDRQLPRRKWRVSIDDLHPQRWLYGHNRGPERFNASGLGLRDGMYRENGPVILCGLGRKSRDFLDYSRTSWESATLQRIRAARPNADVIYRPKPGRVEPALPGTRIDMQPDIYSVLNGASLVVCRHSNVAVDAAFCGIPAVCEDGAASVLYGNDIANPVHPTREQRLDFLQRLAWFQWDVREMVEALKFLREVTGD